VEDIWNTIADAPDALELTEEDKRLIDERLEAHHKNPQSGSPWAEVLSRIAPRKK
jgi:putative addiction module component (TIGR02574 family)